jgi:hypothetical protein
MRFPFVTVLSIAAAALVVAAPFIGLARAPKESFGIINEGVIAFLAALAGATLLWVVAVVVALASGNGPNRRGNPWWLALPPAAFLVLWLVGAAVRAKDLRSAWQRGDRPEPKAAAASGGELLARGSVPLVSLLDSLRRRVASGA